jgi:hydrogenase maturation protein HypF
MNKIQKPIIATSGNVSGSPIIFKDDEALEVLSEIADLILVNDRQIVVPQDDSVLQFSEETGQKIILRRSRGMAPSFSFSLKNNPNKELLAMGAMLKSTFGLIHVNRYYISQFLGDTSTLESQVSYETTLDHMMNLLSFTPEEVITDLHPDYPATILGDKIADRGGIPRKRVQHHEAHSYAVLAENNLLDDDRVLSVVWDGTGYGRDGQIWGGEFFEYSEYAHHRVGQWMYYHHILGDKMSLEPRISALCLIRDVQNNEGLIDKKFEDRELRNFDVILQKGKLYASSVGRIFDGVSSILDLTDYNTYEGEAAMYLEALAVTYLEDHTDFKEHYDVGISETGVINTSELISGILQDKNQGLDRAWIAAKFHVTLAFIIENFMKKFKYKKVAFSGGVFQNNLLVELIIKTLIGNYSVYFHKDLSPNDECIPFGQLIAHQVEDKKLKQ